MPQPSERPCKIKAGRAGSSRRAPIKMLQGPVLAVICALAVAVAPCAGRDQQSHSPSQNATTRLWQRAGLGREDATDGHHGHPDVYAKYLAPLRSHSPHLLELGLGCSAAAEAVRWPGLCGAVGGWRRASLPAALAAKPAGSSSWLALITTPAPQAAAPCPDRRKHARAPWELLCFAEQASRLAVPPGIRASREHPLRLDGRCRPPWNSTSFKPVPLPPSCGAELTVRRAGRAASAHVPADAVTAWLQPCLPARAPRLYASTLRGRRLRMGASGEARM